MVKQGLGLICLFVALATPILTSSANCLNKNPFLALLSKKGVKILETVEPRTLPQCTHQWTAHGSCCDQHSLVHYAANDEIAIKNAVHEVQSIIFSMATSFQKILEQVHSPVVKNCNLELFIKTMKGFEVNLASNLNFLNHLNTQINFNRSLELCWQKMAIARTGSLCSTCAGNSQSFFSWNGEAFISPSACTPILRECAMPFSTMMRFMDLTYGFVLNFKPFTTDKQMTSNFEHFRAIGKLNQIIAEEKRSNIVSSINNYLSSNGQPTVEQEADLCGKILKLTHTSFIQRVAGFYSKIKGSTDQMWRVVRYKVGYCQLVQKKYNGNKDAMWADIEKHGIPPEMDNYIPRLLQGHDHEFTTSNLFKGDVSVFFPSKGPMFSVVDVSPNPWFK
jgi:hypothetical protein